MNWSSDCNGFLPVAAVSDFAGVGIEIINPWEYETT